MDGILLFNKPILWTSHDAVDFVRRRIGQRAVGHAGTLDPLATGLLILLLGKATKLSERLSGLDKDYAGSMTLGFSTDTQDLEGRIISTAAIDKVTTAGLEQLFTRMRGKQSQAPPSYSAVKHQGKKLYQWAREGTAVEVKAREIEISTLRLLGYEPPEARFFMTCSKGTYVRTFCDEAGRRLGCGATLSALVRSRIGPFSLDAACDEATLIASAPGAIEKKLQALSGE